MHANSLYAKCVLANFLLDMSDIWTTEIKPTDIFCQMSVDKMSINQEMTLHIVSKFLFPLKLPNSFKIQITNFMDPSYLLDKPQTSK